MEKITKNHLVDMLNQEGFSKTEGKKIVDLIFNHIQEELAKGNVVDIHSFGKFEVTERAERNGLNPLTKEKIVIPATKVVKFKVSKNLKEAVK